MSSGADDPGRQPGQCLSDPCGPKSNTLFPLRVWEFLGCYRFTGTPQAFQKSSQTQPYPHFAIRPNGYSPRWGHCFDSPQKKSCIYFSPDQLLIVAVVLLGVFYLLGFPPLMRFFFYSFFFFGLRVFPLIASYRFRKFVLHEFVINPFPWGFLPRVVLILPKLTASDPPPPPFGTQSNANLSPPS